MSVIITGPGTSSSEAGSYRHIQSSAAAVWTITHDLDFYPNVTVVDSSGRTVEGAVDYLSSNTVEITFSAAFAGEAYLT